MSQALYRKYRSKSLDEIVGQTHITSLLKRAIAADKLSHAYLLTGPHGVGKTSIARILAHDINKLPYDDDSIHLDIIEIDAASNNGIDDVRELRERVHSAPTSAPYKVYIIDEVHMLSKQAFNALLKTLEEPPAHVIFILATTEAHKLPATIISRVQRYNFSTIQQNDIVEHLQMIADNESIAIDKAALELIAHHGAGSFRNNIGLLDQLQSSIDAGETISTQHVETALGITSSAHITELIDAYRHGDLPRITQTLSTLQQTGIEAGMVARQIIMSLQRDITQHPSDIPTLERLLDTAHSQYPYIKLIIALAANADQTAPATAVSKPSAKKPQPASATASELANEPVPTKQPELKAAKPTKKAEQPTTTPLPSSPSDFDWEAFLRQVRTDSVAAHSLLAKSGHDVTDNQLIIYAGKGFNAKRLMDPKQMAHLNASLQASGHSGLELVIKATSKPHVDSHMAAVADIMGGGQEVNIDG